MPEEKHVARLAEERGPWVPYRSARERPVKNVEVAGRVAPREYAFVDAAAFRRDARVLPEAFEALAAAERKAALSARALDRVLRVARTIADLSHDDAVGASSVIEAASLRGLDRLRSGLEAVA